MEQYYPSRRYPSPMSGIVKTDRAIIYAKQQLSNILSEIQNRSTKSIGDTYYRIVRFRSDLIQIFQMSGDRMLVEKFHRAFSQLGHRTLRPDAIEILKDVIKLLDSYEPKEDDDDLQDLKTKIEKLEQQLSENSEEPIANIDISDYSTVFVIMPFNKEFNDVWKGGIEKAAKAESFKPLRIDMLNKSTNITDDIIESIKKCKISIVDVTGNNPNVMFELGYTMASSKPNIIISQSVEFLPFDIRNIRTIVYSNTWSGIEELRQKIQEFLKEFSPKKKSAGKPKK